MYVACTVAISAKPGFAGEVVVGVVREGIVVVFGEPVGGVIRKVFGKCTRFALPQVAIGMVEAVGICVCISHSHLLVSLRYKFCFSSFTFCMIKKYQKI